MFQLLQPIWLYALAGLSIPVVIHLWNQRPGKTLRVGSVALVTENNLSRKKSVKLTEIMLLILRCLLLACIALALTNPFWRTPANKNSKGWILMGKPQMANTYNHFKPLIDSLLQAGLEFHYFEDGFAKTDFQKAVTAADTAAARQVFYRGMVASLNEQVDATLPVYIFTDNYLHNFTGNRSAVSLNLHWFTCTPDTASIKQANDTTSLHVTVYSKSHPNDARYLKAALDAVQQFSKKNIITTLAASLAELPQQQDWLCWLDEEAIPADKKASNYLLYAKGKATPNTSYILPAGKFSFDAIALYTSVIEKDSATKFSTVQWQDGFGRSLLTMEEKNNANYYNLYTHIDPSWNELPWSEAFPQLIFKLLYANHSNHALAGIADKTVIDSTQLMPVLLPTKEAGVKPMLYTETKLSGIFWLIAFVLFFAERLLSFYHRKLFANG